MIKFNPLTGEFDLVNPSSDLTGYYTKTESDDRFLNESSNLSDLDSVVTARTNLGVYSTSEVDALIVTDHGALTGLSDDDHTQYIINAPTTTTRNLVTVPTATAKGLILKSSDNSATNALLEVQSSSATIIKMQSAMSGSSDSSNFLNITGTLPTVLSSVTDGVRIEITSAGSSAQINGAMRLVYNAGYTGSSGTAAFAVTNAANGTGTGTGSANFGQNTNVINSTTGYNIANRNLAQGSSSVNAGNVSRTQVATVGDNIAIMGLARNTNASGNEIAGYFRLTSANNTTAFPSGIDGALVANNDSTTSPIFLGQDNSTTVFDIIDGGSVRLLLDSQQLIFGAGQDAMINYNATNFIIDPDVVGTGRVYIGATGDDDMLLNTIEIDGDINHDGANIGFFGTAPVTQQTELTDELTTITFTAPGTPDYAIQDLVDSSGGAAFGFATKDEGNTVLSVIANLQARVNELETKLTNYGLLVDAD